MHDTLHNQRSFSYHSKNRAGSIGHKQINRAEPCSPILTLLFLTIICTHDSFRIQTYSKLFRALRKQLPNV